MVASTGAKYVILGHSETEDGGAQEGNGKTERSSETEKACEEAGEDRGREDVYKRQK